MSSMKLKDYENINFQDEQEMLSYFKAQEETDAWEEVITNEITALPSENVDPSFIRLGAIPVKYRGTDMTGLIADNVTDDDIKESSENPKLMVAFPRPDGMVVYPMRYTAFAGIQKRAGIGGSAISRLDNYGQQTEMSAENRATCINMGLELYRNRTKILVRQNNPYDEKDGVKVTAMMSGDENDYSVLEQYRLIKALRAELADNFSDFKFSSAATSYEVSSISYDLDDATLKSRIAGTLQSYGQQVNDGDIKVTVRLTTSDVGLCQARLTPIVLINDVPVPIGQVREVKHQNKASIAKFIDEAHQMLKNFRDNLDTFENLGKIVVNNPSDCFKRIYEKLGLSGYRDQLVSIQERIETEHALGCTGYDIYWYFCEMLYLKESTNVGTDNKSDIYKNIKNQEIVAGVLQMNIKEYDY